MKKNTKSTEKAFSFLGWIFILLIFIILSSLLSIFFMGGGEDRVSSESVDFWLYKNSPQVTGEEGSYFIFIKNNSNRDIEDVKINLDLPSGFDLVSTKEECAKKNNSCEWKLDQIKKDVLKDIEFKGKFFSQPGVKYFNGEMEFDLSGFSSRFYKSFQEEINLNSALNFEWEMPTNAGLGENIESNLYLDNDSQEVLDKVKIKINVPDNFVVDTDIEDESNISFSENNLIWEINDLDFKGEEKLSFSGFFENANKRQHIFEAQAIIPFDLEEFIQKEEKKMVSIGEGIDINLKVNNSQEDSFAKWGESLPIELSYYNTNDKTIEDLILSIDILGEHYLEEKPNFNWEIQNIKKGEGVEKRDTINIVSQLVALKSNFSHSTITLLPIVRGKFSSYSNYWTLKGKPIEIKMSTDLSLRAEAKMYNDEGFKIGQGPLPLKENEKTSFWVFWNLKNTTNDLSNVVASSTLPENIEWNDDFDTSIGNISFKPDSRSIKWEIPSLNSFSGGSHSLVQAKFKLSIIPTEDDIKTSPIVLKETEIRAEDDFCQTDILKSHPALDVNSLNNSDLK